MLYFLRSFLMLLCIHVFIILFYPFSIPVLLLLLLHISPMWDK